ncbi:MAG: hypothetical protein HYZ34_11080 [Ignavibacteriae bacterium]|nr:hypothetical protein [Ignavibacteriota bacterium]
MEGKIKGRGRGAVIREVENVCLELSQKYADIIVVLVDSDDDNWKQVKKLLLEKATDYQHMLVIGVADRNIECWLNSDKFYLAEKIQADVHDLDVENPKSLINKKLGVTTFIRKEEEIQEIVKSAPIKNWLNNSGSFSSFYEESRDVSQKFKCNFPNEREN